MINGLSEKQFLVDFTTRLKQVLHPTISQEEYQAKYGIRLKTDISSTTTDIISFYIKCLNQRSERKTIYQIGYIQTNTSPVSYCTSNLGSYKIGEIGIVIEDSKYSIILIPSDPSNSTILKTEAEVFVSQDNKNHISAIEYITQEEYNTYESQGVLVDATEGDLDVNFNYIVDTGLDDPSQIIIQNGNSGEINTIHHAIDSKQLDHTIDLTVNENDSSETIYGSGTLDTSSDSCNIQLNINTEEIVDQVLQDLDLPDATDSQKGVIALAGNLSLGSDTRIPVETINVNGLNRAFIDASRIDIKNQDIHRYANMDTAPKVSGFIVQYIGPTTSNYTNGYFYQFIPTDFAVNKTDTKWIYSSTAEDTGLGIAQYNANLNYLITFGNLEISIQTAVDQTTITDDTRFLISQNGSDLAELTYAELKQYFKIERNPNYLSDLDADFVLTLVEVEDAFEWRQKNVQPMMSVDAPLVYKGSITANTGETDVQALQRQILNPEQGWVYTVLPSKQEYFWNGNEWEYMGQIIEAPEYTAGDAIDINNNDISVVYDGNSIQNGNNGLQASPALYIGGNDNVSVEEKDEDSRVISVLGYKWDPSNKSFAEGKFSNSSSTPAQGSYSHTEGRDTKTDGQAAHAEGYFTLAEGKASHSEGFGILFNTDTTGFDWFETTDYGADLKITIETSSGASSKTILTLLKEIYFISEISDQHIYLYSRDEKKSCTVQKYYLEINGSEFDPEDPYTSTTITSGAIYFKVNDTSLIGGTLDFLVYNYAYGQASHVEGKNTEAYGKNSHAEGLVNKAEGENSHVEGHLNYISFDGYNAHAEGYNTRAMMNQAHSEGANTQAYGENSHVEGEETCAWGKDSHAEGKSSTSPALYDAEYFDSNKEDIYSDWDAKDSGRNGYSCAWGDVSHVEGKNTIALGNNSHAEGQGACAYGDKSHAEGSNTLAQGNNSHAEGDESKAIGFGSHAEGTSTQASGRESHAEGIWTTTNNPAEHAEGSWNVSHKASDTYDNAGNTQHSIGIGNNDIGGGRKNALEIMQNGDMYVYGVGGYQGTNTKVQDSSIKTLQDSLGDINIIETVKVNGTALTPDANKAVDVTDTHQSIAISNNKMYLTGVEDNSGIPTGAQTGVANSGVYAKNGYLYLNGNIGHNLETYPSDPTLNYTSVPSDPINISYGSKKYILINVAFEGNDPLIINLSEYSNSFEGVREIVCRVHNRATNNMVPRIKVTYDQNVSLTNMYNLDITNTNLPVSGNNRTLELVFTFWGANDVTFNGGLSL